MNNFRLKIYIVVLFLIFPFISSADTPGQRENFNVNKEFDKYNRTNIASNLRYISDLVYFYVDDNYWNSLNSSQQVSFVKNIEILSGEFDSKIYPKEKVFWGFNPNFGTGDYRFTILLEEINKNTGGYFETGNGYKKEQVPSSNERDMLALNAEVLMLDPSIIKLFLAHEFQHFISFNRKEKTYNSPEEVWLNELRSEYSISIVGYNDIYYNSNLNRRALAFIDNPDDSLTEWPNRNIDYGPVNLFAEYLVEQYGPGILSETLNSPLTGIDSLNKYLKGKGYYENFGDVFLNWIGALYLNDITKDPKLGYKRGELKNIKILPKNSIYLSQLVGEYSSVYFLKDWQPLWLEYDLSYFSDDSTKSLKIDMSSESGQNFIVSYLVIYNSGQIEKRKINIVSGKGISFISNKNKNLKKVVVLTTKTTKMSNFGKIEPSNYLNVKISVVDSKDIEVASLEDGALIKRPGEKEIYVIWGKYKRYLNPGVIGLYGHLDPTNAIELQPEIFDSYQAANYVKYINDEKVYAIWPDGTKHWLKITPQQWDASSRDWDAIFTINDLELNYYKNGQNIIQ